MILGSWKLEVLPSFLIGREVKAHTCGAYYEFYLRSKEGLIYEITRDREGGLSDILLRTPYRIQQPTSSVLHDDIGSLHVMSSEQNPAVKDARKHQRLIS